VKEFEASVPESTSEEYIFVKHVFTIHPKSISLVSNCKYTEISVKYKIDNTFIFIFFVQDKNTHQLTYLGYVNSTEGKDPTQKGDTSYNPDEFSKAFGFNPPFARSSVKRVTLRESPAFLRKTINVKNGDAKVDKYFMYFNNTLNGQEKLFSCLCRADNIKKTSESWVDVLGFEGVSSTDIESVTSRDDVAVQVIAFIEVANSVLSNFKVIEIELN
jgi:hypothetical protein